MLSWNEHHLWVLVMALPLVSCVTLGQSLNLSETQYFYARSSVLMNSSAMQKTWVRSLGREDPLGKVLATHSSILI